MKLTPRFRHHDEPSGPAKLGRSFMKAASHYFWPRTLTGLFLVYSVVQPNLSYLTGSVLYPNAEDYLKEQGVTESARKKVIPLTFIRVRPAPQDRGIVDFAHAALFEFPTYVGTYFSLKQSASYSAGYALPGVYCFANIASEKGLDVQGVLAGNILGLRRQSLRQLPVTDREVHLYVAIHELGHCHLKHNEQSFGNVVYDHIPDALLSKVLSPEGMAEYSLNRTHGEDHSDHLAADVMEHMWPHTKIRDFILAFRSVSFTHVSSPDIDFAHDNGLILDAQKRGVKEPTKQEIVQSREEVAKLVGDVVNKMGLKVIGKFDVLKGAFIPRFQHHPYDQENDDRFIRRVRIIRDVLQENETTLSPFAKRRLELFLEGMKYFSPHVFQLAMEGPKALSVQAPKPS